MKHVLIFIFSFCLLFDTGAQDLLSSLYSSNELDNMLITHENYRPVPGIENRETWDHLPGELKDKFLKAGEDLLDYEWPALPATTTLLFVRNGNRSEYERLSFPKRSNLGILVIAELIENEGRFLDQIINGIWSICEESYWGVPAHLQLTPAGDGLPDVTEPWVDLFAAETVNFLAWTDYFLGKKLDEVHPLIRKRIKVESDRRIFNAILNTPHIWREFTFNWNPWICSNWLNAILLLEKDQKLRARHVGMALEALDNFLNPYPSDGGCDEGPGYWNVAGSSLFECLEVMNMATGGRYQVFDDPRIRNIGSYIYKVQISKDYFINFADADPSLDPSGSWIHRFGKKIDDPQMMEFGAYYFDLEEWMRGTFNMTRRVLLLTDNEDLSGEDRTLPLPGNVWFPEIQWMLSRDKAGTDKGISLAAKGGHNEEAHNHNDVGNFIVYHDGLPVLIDVGRGTYTARFFGPDRYSLWMVNAAHHNVPVLNGLPQPAGKQFKATDVTFSSKGKKTTLSMELKNAYPEEAGVKTWNRTLIHNKGKAVILAESFQLEEPGSISEILMTTYPPDLTTPGIIALRLTTKGSENKIFQIQYDESLLEATYLKMPLDEPEDQAIIRHWGEDVYRLELKSRNKIEKGDTKIKFTIK